MELPRAGGRKREHLLRLHKCDRETNWKTMSFPAGSGGCGGEGHGYNRTISKRGLRQRNGGSRGDTLATARLAPEGAMRPPYLRCRCLLFDNEITLQVAGCSKKRWIFASLTKTRHQGLAWGRQSPIVTGVQGEPDCRASLICQFDEDHAAEGGNLIYADRRA